MLRLFDTMDGTGWNYFYLSYLRATLRVGQRRQHRDQGTFHHGTIYELADCLRHVGFVLAFLLCL